MADGREEEVEWRAWWGETHRAMLMHQARPKRLIGSRNEHLKAKKKEEKHVVLHPVTSTGLSDWSVVETIQLCVCSRRIEK